MIRIILADDHAAMRHGLRLVLEQEEDFDKNWMPLIREGHRKLKVENQKFEKEMAPIYEARRKALEQK